MAGRVIQGFFIGGRMRPAAAQAVQRRTTGAVPAAGRPPLVHQGAAVAQRFGGADSFAIDPAQVGLARGGGSPLPQAVLTKMEAAFDADFSAVRVHIGPQAARIGAIAFTTGNDLYFAPGQFQPESVKGQQLIGHELAHVIQQRQGRVRALGSGVSVVQDRALEAEADRLGMRAAAHRPMPPRALQASGRPGHVPPRHPIQRAPANSPHVKPQYVATATATAANNNAFFASQPIVNQYPLAQLPIILTVPPPQYYQQHGLHYMPAYNGALFYPQQPQPQPQQTVVVTAAAAAPPVVVQQTFVVQPPAAIVPIYSVGSSSAANPFLFTGNVVNNWQSSMTTGTPNLDLAIGSFGKPHQTVTKAYLDLGARIGKAGNGAFSQDILDDLARMFEANRALSFLTNASLRQTWVDNKDAYTGAKTKQALYSVVRSKMTASFKDETVASGVTMNQILAAVSGRPFEIHHMFYKALYPDLASDFWNLMLAHRSAKESVDGPGQHELFHIVSSGNNSDKFRVLIKAFMPEYEKFVKANNK